MTSTHAPLIALINATPAAIGPARAAFADEFPEARIWNLLDDQLLDAVSAAGGLTEALRGRMRRLIDHAVHEGADGVLLTCSVYGPVADDSASSASVPLLAPDGEAMLEAVEGGYRHVLVLASNESARAEGVARLTAAARQIGRNISVTGVVCDTAAQAALSGDHQALLAALLAAVRQAGGSPEALLLAQYSLTVVQEELGAATGLPVISGPRSAARRLRVDVTGRLA